jgi:hypothetical protein
VSISEKIQNRLRRALGIVSPSLTYMADAMPRPALHLKIAFLGYSAEQTARYLQQLAVDNVEQVRRYEKHRNRVLLKDGTEIIGILPGFFAQRPDGHRFDQVIIADDNRLEILRHRAYDLNVLDMYCRCSVVPNEYRYQYYDLDAEVPLHGV